MKDFSEWYKELCSDVRWFEVTSMNHKGKNFKVAAEFVYAQLIADPQLALRSMVENRKHVYNRLIRMDYDRVFPQLQQPTIEEKKEPEQPPLVRGSEQYMKRTQELIEAIKAAPMMKKAAPITAKERLENSDWRPKPDTIREPSELEKRTAYLQHLQTVRECRAKLFRDSFPDASIEEVQAYVDKFENIDNPLGL